MSREAAPFALAVGVSPRSGGSKSPSRVAAAETDCEMVNMPTTEMRRTDQNPTRKSLPETWIRITRFESYSCEQFPPKPLILNDRESRVATLWRNTECNHIFTNLQLALGLL